MKNFIFSKREWRILEVKINLIVKNLNKNESIPFNTKEISAQTHHYCAEIIRFLNTLKYLNNKIRRSLSHQKFLRVFSEEMSIYFIYRYFWENITYYSFIEEISTYKSHLNNRFNNELSKFYHRMSNFNWNIALKTKDEKNKLSILHSVPTFMVERLIPYHKNDSLIKLFQNINQNYSNSYFCVLNLTQEVNFENLIKFLNLKQEDYFSDENFLHLIHVKNRHKSKLIRSQFYKNKELIIIDKASYISAKLLDTSEDDLICDFCAAPGIKSLIIGKEIKKNSRILSNEVNISRATDMDQFFQDYASDLPIISINADGINLPFRNIELPIFDKILLDVPCTGSGTLFSHPELKWRQSPSFLFQNCFFQEKLIISALKALKIGGILVYTTCSLYAEEGEFQIQKYLLQDYLKPQILPDYIQSPYNINPCSHDGDNREDRVNRTEYMEGMGRVFQNQNYTGSFFYAKLKKIKNVPDEWEAS